MEKKMETVRCSGDCIVSPIGMDSASNYLAVKDGRSELRRYESLGHIHTPFVLSRISRDKVNDACRRENISVIGYTFFERIAILAAKGAIRQSGIDASSERVLFILSTTKGNVAMLDGEYGDLPESRVMLAESARVISAYFGNSNRPLVVCNACISGVVAQIQAMRCLETGLYDHVVVVGADEQSPFIVSGFLSFKAVSDEPCRPFDRDRKGLNPGECAACMVLSAGDGHGWKLLGGAIRNDANHISGPSRTGEGSYLALSRTLEGYDLSRLAFVNVHGTATAYNDEMESIAVSRAGLSGIPLTGYKGYYGHTMGAAGILESIISMYAVNDHTVPATRGFENMGVSCPVNVSDVNRHADGNAFVKLLSGFGGCNAAVLYEYQG